MNKTQQFALFCLGLLAGFSLPKLATHLFYWGVIIAILLFHFRNPITTTLNCEARAFLEKLEE